MSGVYELLSRGVLPPEHQDHPARRAQQSAEGPAARTQRGGQRDSTFPEVPLTASGLELQSVNATAFGRWAWKLRLMLAWLQLAMDGAVESV